MSELQKLETKFVDVRLICQSWLHSRKAFLFLAVFAISNVAWFCHMLTADQWIDVMKWCVPAYIAGNVADSAVSLIKKS